MNLRKRSWVAVPIFLPFFLLGCEAGDPTGSGSLSAEEAEALFQEVADRVAPPLPTMTSLLHQVRVAVRTGEGMDPAVRRAIREYEAAMAALRDAIPGGDLEGARALADQARTLQFEVIVSVLGADVAGSAVVATEEALLRIRERIEGRWIPRHLMARIDALTKIVAQANSALSAGDAAGALTLALRASAGIRGLAPEAFSARAEAAIERATLALEEAQVILGAGGVAGPLALEALERANLYLDRAHLSLERGAYAAALELALTSYQHSNRAVQLNRRGVDPVS